MAKKKKKVQTEKSPLLVHLMFLFGMSALYAIERYNLGLTPKRKKRKKRKKIKK